MTSAAEPKKPESPRDIIVHYCELIKKAGNDYKMYLESEREDYKESIEQWANIQGILDNRIANRPEGMTKEEWHARKNATRKLRDDFIIEGKTGWRLKHNNPIELLEDMSQ